MSQFQPKRPCIICQQPTGIEPYCAFDGLQYVRCSACGLIYVDNFADNEAMYKAYTGGGFKSFRRKLLGPIRKMGSIKGYSHFLQRARSIITFAKQYISLDKKRNFLDIGCNKGFLLAAAIEQDCNVYGVELVTELIRPFCNTHPEFKHQVYSDKFCDVAKRFDDGHFDLITAIDVVEHFEDPLADLIEIHRVLKEDGVLIIQTPDIDCPQAATLGCDWGALKPLEHLHLFGRKNFQPFAKMAGFSEVSVFDPFEDADGNFVAVLRK